MPDQVRVFVSHHHSPDEDTFTRQLVIDLKHAGADVWWDEEGIISGDFVRRINEGLSDRDWLILVMTPAALRSTWVQNEVNAALSEVAAKRMRDVIPLVAQPCNEAAIPPLWRPLHRYDATHDYARARDALLKALELAPVDKHPHVPTDVQAGSTTTHRARPGGIEPANDNVNGHVSDEYRTRGYPRLNLALAVAIAVVLEFALLILLAKNLRLTDAPGWTTALVNTVSPFAGYLVGAAGIAVVILGYAQRGWQGIRNHLPRRVWLNAAIWCALFLFVGMGLLYAISANLFVGQPYSFQQVVPTNCSANPQPWQWAVSGLSHCTSTALYVRQNTKAFTELDLADTYSQTAFEMQVQAQFMNPSDTATYVAVVVQTPRGAGVCGGYIVILQPTGAWSIEQVQQTCQYTLLFSQQVTLRTGQPATISVVVQNGKLTAAVNGQSRQVDDTISAAPGDAFTGLMVQGVGKNSSSEVAFSHFELHALPSNGLARTPTVLGWVFTLILVIYGAAVIAMAASAQPKRVSVAAHVAGK